MKVPFLAPLVTSDLGYFESPKPGHKRTVKQVNVVFANLGSQGILQLASSRTQGTIWAAGPGQNQPLGIGGYQLIQPLDWFDTDLLSIQATASGGSIVQDQSLGSKATTHGAGLPTILTYAQPVAIGELVILTIGTSNANLTNATFPLTITDSKGNVFNRIPNAWAVTPAGNSPGVAIYATILVNAVTTADTISYTNSFGATGSTDYLSAMSFTGMQTPLVPYAANGQAGTSLNPQVSTSTPVSATDLVIATSICPATSTNTIAPGWAPLQSPAISSVSGYINSTADADVTYQGTISASGGWAATLAAIPSGPPSNPSASVILSGDEIY